jgi:tRNA(Ile)-lysidine synthase
VNSPTPAHAILSHVEAAFPPLSWSEVNVVVALSGGADSVALLRAMVCLKQKVGGAGRLYAAHVDHGLRGEASTEDAQWCAALGKQLNVPVEILRADVASRANQDGDGLEAAARDERYRLLTDICHRWGARYLTTAHHRDDQAETVLFRLLRGSGLRGLGGMQSSRPLAAGLTLVRPLLSCSKELVLEYLDSLGQGFRTDASNADEQLTRNRLRHELLPRLRADYNPRVDDALLRLAEHARDWQTALEEVAEQLLGDCSLAMPSEGGFLLQCEPLATAPRVLASEALRLAWRRARLPEQAMRYQHWQQLVELACASSAAPPLNLPGALIASKHEARLSIHLAPSRC